MSKFDWAVTQGLGGQPIDPVLYELRTAHEEELRAIQHDLQSACAEAAWLRITFEEQEAPVVDLAPEIEALLNQAESNLSGKAEDCKRSEQFTEAYRLRHGLTREPHPPHVLTTVLSAGALIGVEAGITRLSSIMPIWWLVRWLRCKQAR